MKLVAVVDDNDKVNVAGVKVILPEKLVAYEYDAILLAIHDKIIAKKMKEQLVKKGIKKEIIYWDGELYSKKDFYNKFYYRLLRTLKG